MSGSLFPLFLLTAVLLPPNQANTTSLSLEQPPFSPAFPNCCPSSRKRGHLAAFYCPVLPLSLPWGCSSGWKVWVRRPRTTCAPASMWEDGVGPEASGNACLCQDTEGHSDYVRGVVSFGTKGKAG